MRRLNVLILISMILAASFMSILPDEVEAGEGYAKVYIVCLPDVGGWTFPDRPYEPTRTRDGAIDAANFKERYKLPLAHPIQGNSPPYYGVTYYVVQSWSLYKSIIESYVGVIVINIHGEIIPVPSGYNREGWVDKIAEAMLKRRITWVHTAGYPFYYAWYQGTSNMELWGEDGFKRLMSHINLTDVTCLTDDELTHVDINNAAEQNLAAWKGLSQVVRVQRGRPLKASDFQNYTILPIWGCEDTYMTGAVVAFVKPSERLPKDCRGFGAYVHIGTNATFDEMMF